MELVYHFLVILHFVGMAAVVGGYAAVAKAPKYVPVMLHGAATQVLTGLLLVGMLEAGAVDKEPDHAKIGVKLVIAVIVLAMTFMARKAGEKAGQYVSLAAGLAMANVAVAVLW